MSAYKSVGSIEEKYLNCFRFGKLFRKEGCANSLQISVDNYVAQTEMPVFRVEFRLLNHMFVNYTAA